MRLYQVQIAAVLIDTNGVVFDIVFDIICNAEVGIFFDVEEVLEGEQKIGVYRVEHGNDSRAIGYIVDKKTVLV